MIFPHIFSFQVVNKILYSGSSDHTGRAWVTEFGDCTRIYKGHKHTVSVIKMKDGLGTCDNLSFINLKKKKKKKKTRSFIDH